jgi:hypothetical protein
MSEWMEKITGARRARHGSLATPKLEKPEAKKIILVVPHFKEAVK